MRWHTWTTGCCAAQAPRAHTVMPCPQARLSVPAACGPTAPSTMGCSSPPPLASRARRTAPATSTAGPGAAGRAPAARRAAPRARPCASWPAHTAQSTRHTLLIKKKKKRRGGGREAGRERERERNKPQKKETESSCNRAATKKMVLNFFKASNILFC